MKFKRHICLLLAFFLLVSNSGMAFSVHYCGDEIASISSVFSKDAVCEMPVEPVEKECCVPKVKSHKSCCDDKVVDLQDESDDVIVKSFSFNIDIPFLIQEWNPIIVSSNSNFKSTQIASYYCDANAPPFFKLYHQYVFYA
jgi:hypothetical protein